MSLACSDSSLVPNVYPLGMGSLDLVLQDEEGNSVVTELEELSSGVGEDLVEAQNTAINLENCNDVIVGPVTQFNGPVTFYQNINGHVNQNGPADRQKETIKFRDEAKLVKSESTSSETAHPIDSHDHKKLIRVPKRLLKYAGISFLILVTSIAIICTTIFTVGVGGGGSDSDSETTTELPSDNKTIAPPRNIGGHSLIYRNEWGGRPPKSVIPLNPPTAIVVIAHTATGMCWTVRECSDRVKSIQEYGVGEKNSSDIFYNFLFGGDGNIYVGRGWRNKNPMSTVCIIISFIGNFLYDELTDDMIDAATKLLQYGMDTAELTQNYTLLAHNQTFATQSPGPNVYRIIKNWDHFDPTFLPR